MSIFPQYQSMGSRDPQSGYDELRGLLGQDLYDWGSNAWKWATNTKAAPDPTPPEYSRPDWNLRDALSNRAGELKQHDEALQNGQTFIRQADPWQEARNNAQTSFIDWLSPTIGDALQGQPYDPAKIIGDLAGWADAPAKGMMGAAGLIRMGRKEFPTAMLHRAVGDSREVGWWGKMFQKGIETQKPTSIVTPGYLPTFGSHEYGLLFDVPDVNRIAHAGLEDVYSNKSKIIPESLVEELRALEDRIALGRARSVNNFVSEQRAQGSLGGAAYDQWSNRYGKLYEDLLHDIIGAADVADTSFRPRTALGSSLPIAQTWEPGFVEHLVNPETTGLDTFFRQFTDLINRKPKPPLTSTVLHHNEIIPNISADMLAGVRVPNFSRDELSNTLTRALRELAQDRGVPIYSWPAKWKRGDQMQMLIDPLAGTWEQAMPFDYLTSSELGRPTR